MTSGQSDFTPFKVGIMLFQELKVSIMISKTESFLLLTILIILSTVIPTNYGLNINTQFFKALIRHLNKIKYHFHKTDLMN